MPSVAPVRCVYNFKYDYSYIASRHGIPVTRHEIQVSRSSLALLAHATAFFARSAANLSRAACDSSSGIRIISCSRSLNAPPLWNPRFFASAPSLTSFRPCSTDRRELMFPVSNQLEHVPRRAISLHRTPRRLQATCRLQDTTRSQVSGAPEPGS